MRRAAATAVVACVATVASAQGAAGSTAAPAPAASSWSDWSNRASWWPWGGDGKPPAPTGVQSPHYGDSLFHFFQGRYFTSVTGLMVSQHFARVAPHDDEAEVLRGGLFLSYGLHREAGDVFARLIERGAAPAVRDRAWFYLAKIRYQRGLLAEAEDALGRIEQRLPGELEEDRVLLQANVQMARGRYAEAIRTLDTLAKGPGASSYVRYNLGIALIRGGDPARWHGAARRSGQAAGDERGVSKPAGQGEPGARIRRPAGRPRRRRARLSRARAAVGHAVEQGAPRLRLGRGVAGTDEGRAGAVERTGRPRGDRRRGARGQARGALRARRTRRRCAGARAVSEGDRRLRSRGREPGPLGGGDPRGQVARRPDRPQPGRGDGLVLEHRGPAGAAGRAAWRPSRAVAGDARVPGSVQELPRPALPRAQPAAVAGHARGAARHARQPTRGPSRSACRRCAQGNSRWGRRTAT